MGRICGIITHGNRLVVITTFLISVMITNGALF